MSGHIAENDALTVAVPVPLWDCYCGWDKAHGPRCPDCGGRVIPPVKGES